MPQAGGSAATAVPFRQCMSLHIIQQLDAVCIDGQLAALRRMGEGQLGARRGGK